MHLSKLFVFFKIQIKPTNQPACYFTSPTFFDSHTRQTFSFSTISKLSNFSFKKLLNCNPFIVETHQFYSSRLLLTNYSPISAQPSLLAMSRRRPERRPSSFARHRNQVGRSAMFHRIWTVSGGSSAPIEVGFRERVVRRVDRRVIITEFYEDVGKGFRN